MPQPDAAAFSPSRLRSRSSINSDLFPGLKHEKYERKDIEVSRTHGNVVRIFVIIAPRRICVAVRAVCIVPQSQAYCGCLGRQAVMWVVSPWSLDCVAARIDSRSRVVANFLPQPVITTQGRWCRSHSSSFLQITGFSSATYEVSISCRRSSADRRRCVIGSLDLATTQTARAGSPAPVVRSHGP